MIRLGTLAKDASMGRNQILAVALFSLSCLGYSITSANAGWFGPSNYAECMIEKMKGQPFSMSEFVAETCTLQFACNYKFSQEYKKCINNDGFTWAGQSDSCTKLAFHNCTDP